MAYSHLTPQRRILVTLAVAALHAGCLALLVRYSPAAQPRTAGMPVTVSLVQPLPVVAPPARPPPKPVPARRVQRTAPPKAPPVIAAPASTPAPAPVVPTAVADPIPVQEAPAPAREALRTVEIAHAEPVPVMPPSFNANYLDNPAPAYPALSRRLGEEGRVMLRVFVNEHGAPDRIELRRSSGHLRLDEVALDTVKRWKFVPAKRGDQPVGAWVLVPISFNLRS